MQTNLKIIKKALKADDKNADLLRKKAYQNNEILANLIEKSSVLIEGLELPYKELDWNTFLKTSPLDYEETFIQFVDKNPGRDFLLKNSICKQIYEIFRENAGFKMAYNNLVHILLKYKNIIEEIMRSRANLPSQE